jgi:NADH-quinone oxidoreductase subunit N
VLWAVAIASMAIGAVIGLTQSDVKRMVAYSRWRHAGFLLIGAMAITSRGIRRHAVLPAGYGFTTLAFSA